MQRLAHKLQQFLALTASERRTVLAAMAWLPLFWIGLRALGLQRLQAWLQRKPLPRPARLTAAELPRLGQLVNAATHHTLGPANCLTRSLYLWWWLRRRGVDSQVRIGVRIAGSTLEAHAWVEHAGVPINDRNDVSTDFPPFAEHVSPKLFTAP
jgi:hypothetical protein